MYDYLLTAGELKKTYINKEHIEIQKIKLVEVHLNTGVNIYRASQKNAILPFSHYFFKIA